MDPSPESVAALVAAGIAAQAGRIEAMPFADDEFDCVVASEVFEHLTDSQRARGLAEIRRVLKPGGYLLGTVPYREVLENNFAICPKCQQVFHRWGHTTSFDLAKVRGELAPSLRPDYLHQDGVRAIRGSRIGGQNQKPGTARAGEMRRQYRRSEHFVHRPKKPGKSRRSRGERD